MDKPGRNKTIKASQLTAFERWELPLMDESGNEIPEDEPEIKPLTAEDLEQIRRDAHSAGMEEGYKEGRDQGYQIGFNEGLAEGKTTGLVQGTEKGRKEAYENTEREVRESLSRLQNVMEELLDPIRRHEDQLEQAILNMVLAISRVVVMREVQADSSQIMVVIKQALALLPSTRTSMRIHIHGQDREYAIKAVRELDAESVLVVDDTILPGGCRVETSQSLVDFTVDKRFQKTIQSLLQNAHRKVAEEQGTDLVESLDELSDLHRAVLEEPLPIIEASDASEPEDNDPDLA